MIKFSAILLSIALLNVVYGNSAHADLLDQFTGQFESRSADGTLNCRLDINCSRDWMFRRICTIGLGYVDGRPDKDEFISNDARVTSVQQNRIILDETHILYKIHTELDLNDDGSMNMVSLDYFDGVETSTCKNAARPGESAGGAER